MTIHPTAIIGDGVTLGQNVEIGPFCVLDGKVTLEDGVKLHPHVVIDGCVTVGEGTEIFSFVSLNKPQDLKFHGENSAIIIGKNNQIREYVTIQPGTEGGIMKTQIGDNCLLMVGAHVAHDCVLGDNVIMANNATLAGHVTVGNFAILGGLCAIHQFVRVGAHAMIGGMAGVKYDVIPFGTVSADADNLSGLNVVGMNRRGYQKDQIRTLRDAYLMLFNNNGTLAERINEVNACFGEQEAVKEILDFINVPNTQPLSQPVSQSKHSDTKGES